MTAQLVYDRLQSLIDGPGNLGAGQDGQFMRWNNTTGLFEMAAAGITPVGVDR